MSHAPSAVTLALRSLRGGYFAIAIFSLAINLMMLAGPLYMLQVYDRVLTSKSSETLIALSLLLAAIFVVSGVLDLIRLRILNRLGARFEARAGGPIFDAVMKRKVSGKASSGDVPTSDLNAFREFLSGNTLIAFFDSPWVPIYLAVLFILHPLLGVLGAFGALVLFILAFANDRLSRKPMARTLAGQKQADGTFAMCERNAESMLAMGMNADLRQRWSFLQASTNLLKTSATDRVASFSVVSKTFRLALQSAMLGLGAALAIFGEASPGVMIAATIILSRALSPIDQAIGQWRVFTAALGSYGKLKALVQAFPPAQRTMSFPEAQRNVSVSIQQAASPSAERATISGISFNLEAGDVTAVIGPSGSGKSTLSRMLAGIWHPQRGEVCLDNIATTMWSGKSTLSRMLAGIWHPQRGEVCLDNIATTMWNVDELGVQVGFLPQDVELFEGTIRENISRFGEQPDDEAVLYAARQANVHDMILQMPDGYDTLIGPGGQFLSGGERQRIGLARALYGDPFLLVLDEPNANLDATGDAALRHAVQSAKARGAITVVVTHRPSTLDAVNKVLVLENGRQHAFGPKEDVLRATTKVVSTNTATNTSVTPLTQRATS